jgi:hypothetical protein
MKAQILNVAEKNARLLKITKANKQLSTPSFFPAVSGLGFGENKIDTVITPSNYLGLERSMLRISSQNGLNPAILDMAIWNHMRSDRPSK